ncbi:MAG: methyltransferase domain-containing protein [Corynebacteriales bacterium]|nr:methyltransferase domain-containing protein [Mycobacteriales bacterium]
MSDHRAAEFKRKLLTQLHEAVSSNGISPEMKPLVRAALTNPRILGTFSAVYRGDFFGDAKGVYIGMGDDPFLMEFGDRATSDLWKTVVTSPNNGWITQLDAQGQRKDAHTPPSVLAGLMALAFDGQVDDGRSKVLHVGTGPGYFAALLATYLQDHKRLTSIDIDPEVVSKATKSLNAAGFFPNVEVADGLKGPDKPELFRTLIASVATDEIPPAWVDLIEPGGQVIAPVRGANTEAVLQLKATNASTLEGKFKPAVLNMMRVQAPALNETSIQAPSVKEMTSSSITADSFEPDSDFLFFLERLHPRLSVEIPADPSQATVLRDNAGNQAKVHFLTKSANHTQQIQIERQGAKDLWAQVAESHGLWQKHGEPKPTELGVTVTAQGSALWAREPDALISPPRAVPPHIAVARNPPGACTFRRKPGIR